MCFTIPLSTFSLSMFSPSIFSFLTFSYFFFGIFLFDVFLFGVFRQSRCRSLSQDERESSYIKRRHLRKVEDEINYIDRKSQSECVGQKDNREEEEDHNRNLGEGVTYDPGVYMRLSAKWAV